MGIRALLYAYVLGGFTCIPLLIAAAVFFTIYTSVPVGDPDPAKRKRGSLEKQSQEEEAADGELSAPRQDTDDTPKTRKGWLTVRRTFEEPTGDGSYVTLMRSFLDSRSKDPKRARPKDMWYCVLKGKVLFLYEDEGMTECEGAIEMGGHEVLIYPEGLSDGELFTKRNAICLRPKISPADSAMPSVTKEMKLEDIDVEKVVLERGGSERKKAKEAKALQEVETRKEAAREEALNINTPWFIFVRSCVEMEDWYLALIHSSDHPPHLPTLEPLQSIFNPEDMKHLVNTLDEQPDVIPMRWLNALIGRILFSYYRTEALESGIIRRVMKKLSKVKLPTFLTNVVVTEVSVGNRSPTLSKPMLKELTKEGDAALEVHILYKGEIRITIEATATISIGTFRSYTVKLAIAVVLKELEGNLLVKVKRPPTNRLWYAFTQMPRMVLELEPIVSDRQITWGMILSTIESKIKEVVQESVVMPFMDDFAFFDSHGYNHRGGIWPDASRNEKRPTAEDILDEAMSVVSAPAEESSNASPIETEAEPTPLAKSKSEEILPQPSNLSSPEPPAAIPVQSAPAAPYAVDDVSDSEAQPSNANRRRSWFSSIRSEGIPSLQTEEEEDSSRGRTSEIEPPSTQRSRSTPAAVAEPPLSSSQDSTSGETTPVDSGYLTPERPSRSGTGRGHSHSLSSGSAETSGSNSTLSTKNRDGQILPSSPTSFLSTLKSRAAAADKQAISNSAKEAMRKWGVNWGGFKKDSPSSDDASDSGSLGTRLGLGSTGSLTSKARSSYAEVRAAVAERRDRDKSGDEGSPGTPCSPIPIPDGDKGPGKERSRVTSTSSGYSGSMEVGSPDVRMDRDEAGTSSSRRKPSMSASHQPRPRIPSGGLGPDPEPPAPSTSPIFVQPQARTMTMTIPGIHASHRGEVQAIENKAPTPPMDGNKLKTINPAIQSMYRLWKSPPLNPQSQQPEGASTSDSGSNPNSHSNQQPSTTESGLSFEQNADVAPLALSSVTGSEEAPSASRPQSQLVTHLTPPTPVLLSNPRATVSPSRSVPPPLPPRSASTAVSKAAVDLVSPSDPSGELTTQQNGSVDGEVGQAAAGMGMNELTASEALKSIASGFQEDAGRPSSRQSASSSNTGEFGVVDDANETASIGSNTGSPRRGPPLPPRRSGPSAGVAPDTSSPRASSPGDNS
jgi:hypothetical protein